MATIAVGAFALFIVVQAVLMITVIVILYKESKS